MKKIVILLAFMLSLSIAVNAQLKYGPRISIGSTNLGQGKSLVGFQLGLVINAELKDRMGIQPEILYSYKTGTLKADGSSTSTLYTFSYLDIPVYVYLPVSPHITFLAGPQLGVVNSAKSIVNGKDYTINAKAKLGFAAGLDLNLKSSFKFGLRYTTTGGEPLSGKSSFMGVSAAYLLKW